MKRKEFIKAASLLTAGSMVFPNLLAEELSISHSKRNIVWINLSGGVRKQDVITDSVIRNFGKDFSKIETLMPKLLGGQIPIKYNNAMLEFRGESVSQPLIKNGALFSAIKGQTIGHTSSAEELFTIPVKNSSDRIHVLEMLLQDSSFSPNQLFFVGNNPSFNKNWIEFDSDEKVFEHAKNILKKHKPKLLTINLSDSDSGHSDFTSYAISLSKVDQFIFDLWCSVQNKKNPMSGNTTFVITNQLGRNLNPNSIKDKNGFNAFDHSDENSKELFCIVLGENANSHSNALLDAQSRKNEHIAPTVLEFLGVRNQMVERFKLSVSNQLLVG